MYCKVSVGLKCVRTSRMVNLLPLYTHVWKVISISEIYGRMIVICQFYKHVYFLFFMLHREKTFPSEHRALGNF